MMNCLAEIAQQRKWEKNWILFLFFSKKFWINEDKKNPFCLYVKLVDFFSLSCFIYFCFKIIKLQNLKFGECLFSCHLLTVGNKMKVYKCCQFEIVLTPKTHYSIMKTKQDSIQIKNSILKRKEKRFNNERTNLLSFSISSECMEICQRRFHKFFKLLRFVQNHFFTKRIKNRFVYVTVTL